MKLYDSQRMYVDYLTSNMKAHMDEEKRETFIKDFDEKRLTLDSWLLAPSGNLDGEALKFVNELKSIYRYEKEYEVINTINLEKFRIHKGDWVDEVGSKKVYNFNF